MRQKVFLLVVAAGLASNVFGQVNMNSENDLISNCLTGGCQVNIVNTGENGAPLNGPGFGALNRRTSSLRSASEP